MPLERFSSIGASVIFRLISPVKETSAICNTDRFLSNPIHTVYIESLVQTVVERPIGAYLLPAVVRVRVEWR